MRARKALGQLHTDRAHGDVNGEMLKPCKYPVRAEHYALDHSVVCEHGDDNVTACGLTRRLSKGGTFGDEYLGFIRRAVKTGECVAGPEQIGGHAAAHATKPDESDLHDLPLHKKPCPGLDGGNAAIRRRIVGALAHG